MDRRKFLKAASGLFVPALPALILPAKAQGPILPGPGLPVAPAGLGLQANLGSFFSLDNTLNDATGNVTALTNNNSVTFVTSPAPPSAVTRSANFVNASSQSLSHADATGLNVAGIDFSIQIWVYCTANTRFALSKNSGSFGNREYSIEYSFGSGASNPYIMRLNSSGAFGTTGNFSNNAWHHVVYTFNNTSKAYVFYVDGASAVSGTAGGVSLAGTSDFYIGANTNGGAPGTFWDGNICLVGTWRNRILTAGDVTLLYNSGNGLSYAAML